MGSEPSQSKAENPAQIALQVFKKGSKASDALAEIEQTEDGISLLLAEYTYNQEKIKLKQAMDKGGRLYLRKLADIGFIEERINRMTLYYEREVRGFETERPGFLANLEAKTKQGTQ